MTNDTCNISLQGLGEVYEEQYVRGVVGDTSEDNE